MLLQVEFRPTKLEVDLNVQSMSVVLCNDKPQTFGAPDVLQLSVDALALQYHVDQSLPDRPPNQVSILLKV